jgi:hypothetical protein
MSSQHVPGSRLDAAIDRAVRQILSTDPPEGLRRRVLARLDAPPAPAAWWPRLGLAAAGVAALILAMVYVQPADSPIETPAPIVAEAPATPEEVGRPESIEPSAVPARPFPVAAATPRVERLPDPPKMDQVFGSAPDGRVAAATVDVAGPAEPAGAEPEPGSLPFEIPAITIPPLIIEPVRLPPLRIQQ